ncbi:MAG TPA: STAS domain-containing protein [Gaiellaceae bacterium]|nr:STAS domain-containing protein [Gaiellaceae bacterium]
MSREEPDGLRRLPVDGVDRRNGDVVVRLAGEIDLYNAAEVGSTLEEIAGSGPERVVVDLGEVEFVDSTALGTLIEARKQLGNGRLVLAAPGHDVRRALEVAGLLEHFDVHDSVDAALAS